MGDLAFPRRKIWTQQPQQAPRLQAYWRSKGLVFVHNPAMGEINLANSRVALNTTGFPRDVGIAGRRINAAGASKSEFTDNGLSGSGNSLTLISIWRAKDTQYASGDATRFLLSTRTAGNAGWGWGRSSAIAGGATGNLTAQAFVLNGVAQYSEANSTIESFVDTVVACRVKGTTVSWFRFGKKSSNDTTVGTASTGTTTTFGAGGPYSGAGNIWNDRAYLTLAFNKPLSDADIFALCKDVKSPWQVFAPRSTYLFSVTALANIISLGLVSAQFSAQVYQASSASALGAGSAGAGAYAVSPAGVLSTAVSTVPVTSQAAFVSAVQSLQGASVSLNSPDLDYILGALSNAVSLGLASISSTARAITYSTPGGTVHVVPYEFLGDYDIVHFSGSIAVDRAGALIIVLR